MSAICIAANVIFWFNRCVLTLGLCLAWIDVCPAEVGLPEGRLKVSCPLWRGVTKTLRTIHADISGHRHDDLVQLSLHT